jgi:hypothetical protein
MITCIPHSEITIMDWFKVSGSHFRIGTNSINIVICDKLVFTSGRPGDRGSILCGGKEDFSSSLCIQTSPEAHPASCPVGTAGPFPGGKARPARDSDHSPHLVSISLMSGSHASSLPCTSMACSGRGFPFCIHLADQEVPAFNGTRIYITVFLRARWIQSTFSYIISWLAMRLLDSEGGHAPWN